jgi:hypothetical protein
LKHKKIKLKEKIGETKEKEKKWKISLNENSFKRILFLDENSF